MTRTLTNASRSAAVGLLLLIAAPAQGQQPTEAQISAIRQSCRADYRAHCANVPTGGQAALACLQQNEAQLSAACRQAVAATGGGAPRGAAPGAGGGSADPAARGMPSRGEGEILRGECAGDVRTVCHGVPPGSGRVLACLADRRESLSHGCREALMAIRERR